MECEKTQHRPLRRSTDHYFLPMVLRQLRILCVRSALWAFGDFGGSSGWSGTNFSIAYETGEDGVLSETTNDEGETINVLLDISEATFAPDGFHYGNLGFGWGFN